MERKSRVKEAKQKTSILVLPVEVMVDIFLRLPIKVIFACSWSCKIWRTIILGRNFANAQLPNAPTCLMLLLDEPCFCLIEFNENFPIYPRNMLKIDAQNYLPANIKVVIQGSCNGLICISDNDCTIFCICNPFRVECMPLPIPEEVPDYLLWNSPSPCGFGFCKETNQYKVVRLFGKHARPMTIDVTPYPIGVCQIHTFGTVGWRIIRNVPLPGCRNDYLIYLNGALHWLVDGFIDLDHMLCSFDIGRENFQWISVPQHCSLHDGSMRLSMVENCLVLGIIHDYHCEIWVMNDYGVKESWTKCCTLNGWTAVNYLNSIIITKNRDMLLSASVRDLHVYTPGIMALKIRKVYKIRHWRQRFVYKPSFVSVGDASENAQ